MNVIYSSDDNYARHVGISITSLYDHCRDMADLDVYLIDDGISPENHQRLDLIAQKYGRQIHYIPFGPHKEKLSLNNKWELPISAYARLFVAEMVPETLDRILYLDCDTVICDSLRDLWETDMQGKTIAAVEDVTSCVFQPETDSPQPYRYICSGVIMIDLKKWRAIDAQKKMLDYLDGRNGVVRHHDQTILNGVFWDDCHILHPRYDALTPTFIMSYDNLKAYFGLWDRYYTKQEIRQSTKKPAIIHYTSSHIGRPWENSKHPKAKVYQRYWKASAWRNEPWGSFRSPLDPGQRRIYWMYRHLPVRLIRLLSHSGTA